LKKIGDKKELDIKFDDFLTNLIFSVYQKKKSRDKLNKIKVNLFFKKKWQKGLILNKLISIKQNIHGIDPNLFYKSIKVLDLMSIVKFLQ
jgi:hypothetical protein